jgi:hypothetical protein
MLKILRSNRPAAAAAAYACAGLRLKPAGFFDCLSGIRFDPKAHKGQVVI